MATRKGTFTTHNANLEGASAFDDDDEPVNKAIADPSLHDPMLHEIIPAATPYADDPLTPMWWVRAFGAGVPYEPAPDPEAPPPDALATAATEANYKD